MKNPSPPEPSVLGLRKSFGYGDRLGLAGPGHIAANKHGSFAPILAQQSIREMTRTARNPDQVMQAARVAIVAGGFDQAWGADADHLKTREDVEVTSRAGFCFFTIDPSEYVRNDADLLDQSALEEGVRHLLDENVLPSDWENYYLGKTFELEGGTSLDFDQETLHRAAVKYARAIHHSEAMAGWIAECQSDRPYEIEVSVDETDSPTSPREHLFFALELRRRQVKVVSLAPRFVGEFEKGIDYKGDLQALENSLRVHVSIAKRYGPYKISVHSGSDKFSAYPIIGRVCGDLLHVKTAGTSYLEALRVICRQNPSCFREIIDYSLERFSEDRASYHISASEEDFTGIGSLDGGEYEKFFLESDPGRQLLHVTFGSVLTRGTRESGQSFKEAILETLEKEKDIHAEFLEIHLGKHVRLLEKG